MNWKKVKQKSQKSNLWVRFLSAFLSYSNNKKFTCKTKQTKSPVWLNTKTMRSAQSRPDHSATDAWHTGMTRCVISVSSVSYVSVSVSGWNVSTKATVSPGIVKFWKRDRAGHGWATLECIDEAVIIRSNSLLTIATDGNADSRAGLYHNQAKIRPILD